MKSMNDKPTFLTQKRSSFLVPHLKQPEDHQEELQGLDVELGSGRSSYLCQQDESSIQHRGDQPNQATNLKNLKEKQGTFNKDQGFSNKIWKKRALRIVYHVSKFLVHLVQSTESVKFKLLSLKIFGLINDPSSDYDFYVFNRMVKGHISLGGRLKRKAAGICYSYLPVDTLIRYQLMEHHTFRKCQAIEPDSNFKILWDIFIALLIIVNIFYLPMKLAFQLKNFNSEIAIFILDTLPSWAFLLEIVINFNTAFYDQGKINYDRKAILVNYMKGDFFIDMLVIIPVFIRQYDVPYVEFALLLRITRVKSLFENVEEALNLREKFAPIVDLVKLIYFVIFVSHFCACAWYQIALWEGVEESWLAAFNIQHEDIITKYIYSLYWSTITLTTVGYGDVSPVTNTEMVFVIVMTLISCGVFGYAINSIGAIFKEMEEKKERIRNQMSMLNSHMRRHHLSKQLQLKVRKYFEYYFQRQDEQDEQISSLVNQLSQDLKSEVMIDIYKDLLYKSKFLRENFSEACLQKLCLYVKEQKFSPDEVIFDKNQVVDKLYFLQSGRVKIQFEKIKPGSQLSEQKEVKHFKEGQVLAEKNFILNNEIEYRACASAFSQLAYIKYQDLLQCLSGSEDYERFFMIKDNVKFNKFFKKVSTMCEICQSNHQFTKCPFTFYQANRLKLLRKQNESKPNKRLPSYLRDTVRRHFDLGLIQQATLAICLNEKLLREDELDDNYLIQLGFGDEANPSLLEFEEQFERQISTIQANSNVYQMTSNSAQSPNPNLNLSHNVSAHSKNRKVTISEVSNIQPEDTFKSSLEPMKSMKSSLKADTYKNNEFDEDKFSYRIEQSHQMDDANDRSQSNLDLTPRVRGKGILKKSSFLPSQANIDESEKDFERKLSKESDEGDRNKVFNNSKGKIKRRQERHNLMSFKYDRANSLLQKMKLFDKMMSMKSMDDNKSIKSKFTSKSGLERQFTSQTQQVYYSSMLNYQAEQEDEKKNYLSSIQEDNVPELDKNKNFEIYFPSFNLDIVLINFNRHQKNGLRDFSPQNTLSNGQKRSIMSKQLMRSSYLQKRKKEQEEEQNNDPVIEN